ncbi:MAG: sigma-70 family RNA polymerase sigma factor [Planctomycetaceae bacterium]|nr:sigma-70 family RNA polymerase sigma factor [Planctomycetaceae bacterium]
MSDFVTRKQHFEQCIEQHHQGLYRVALRLTGREAVALELVQETYLQAWRGLSSLRDVERMRAWLFAILRRQFCKSLGRPTDWLASDVESNASSEDSCALRNCWLEEKVEAVSQSQQFEQRELIHWAIQRLDVRYRFPVLLQLMEEMSVHEISQALELPTGTVLSHLHRGKQQLRVFLEREMSNE